MRNQIEIRLIKTGLLLQVIAYQILLLETSFTLTCIFRVILLYQILWVGSIIWAGCSAGAFGALVRHAPHSILH